jgi:hypothetical protein
MTKRAKTPRDVIKIGWNGKFIVLKCRSRTVAENTGNSMADVLDLPYTLTARELANLFLAVANTFGEGK